MNINQFSYRLFLFLTFVSTWVFAADGASTSNQKPSGFARRSDLANSASSKGNVETKPGELVSVKDRGAVGDGVADDTAAFKAALAQGGMVDVPPGTYKITAPLNISKKTILKGAGRLSSTLLFTHVGDGIKSTWPINGSTGVWIGMRDIGIVNNNASNMGGGFVDVGGSFVDLGNVYFGGWKYGVIFDQTEIATIDASEFVVPIGGVGLWLVNGASHTVGARHTFTNRITVSRNQFNAAAGALYNILDDGGGNHSFRDNNLNAGVTGMRLAGVSGLVISGNESEGHTAGDIYFADKSSDGVYVGPCTAFEVSGNGLVSIGNNNISIQNAVHGKITSNMFGQGKVAMNFINELENQSTGLVIEGNGKLVTGSYRTAGPFISGDPRVLRRNFVRQAASTFVSGAASAGSATLMPASMEFIGVGTRLHLENADGTNSEDTQVTAVTAKTFTAKLASAKNANFLVYGATPHDQEEGVWSPVLGATSISGMHTYSLQAGQWSRRGNMVHIEGAISVSSKDDKMNGDLVIAGLPFALEDIPNGYATVNLTLYSGVTLIGGYTHVGGIISPGNKTITINKSGSGLTMTPAQTGDIPGSSAQLYFNATYPTSD